MRTADGGTARAADSVRPPLARPASTAASACPPVPPTSPPATRPTAPAGASCSCARWSAARSAPTTPRWCSTSMPASAAGAASRSARPAWRTAAGSRRRASGCSRRAACRRSRARCSACSGTSGSGGRCSPLARAFGRRDCPRLLAGGGRVGFGMGMLAASGPACAERGGPTGGRRSARRDRLSRATRRRPTVALFRGCVMDTLFRHVHDATRRTLEANGYASSRSRARPAAARCTSTPATAPRPRRWPARNVAALAGRGGLHRR